MTIAGMAIPNEQVDFPFGEMPSRENRWAKPTSYEGSCYLALFSRFAMVGKHASPSKCLGQTNTVLADEFSAFTSRSLNSGNTKAAQQAEGI